MRAKVLFAFLGGVVLASGFFFVISRERLERPKPVAAAPAPVPVIPTVTAPVAPPTAPEVEKEPPATPVAKHSAAPRRVTPPPARPVERRPEPVQVAVATPVPAPAPVPPPPASVVAKPVPAPVAAKPAPMPDPVMQTPEPVEEPAPVEPVRTIRMDPPAAPPPPAPNTVALPRGLTLRVRLAEALSTDRSYAGDAFGATLDQPLVVDGFVIAERGARVFGRVVESQKAGHTEGLSRMTLELTQIETSDHQRVRITTSKYQQQGPKSTGENAAKIGGGAALGAIIGAIAGGGKGAAIGAAAGGAAGTGVVVAGRGKPTVFPVETKLSFELQQPVTITEQSR